MEAKLIDTALPHKLVRGLLLFNDGRKLCVEIGASCVVFKRLNGLFDSLFERSVFEKDELLLHSNTVFTNVIGRGILNEKETEDVLEKLNIFI